MVANCMSEYKFPKHQYEQKPSKVKSVVLYKKKLIKQEDESSTPVEEFHCPQCDAPIRFVPVDGLTCDHCGYREQPTLVESPKEAQKGELTPEIFQNIPHGWGLPRRTLLCQRCQAHSSVPVSSVTYTCPFCGSNRVAETHEENDVIRPSKIIPFKIEKTAVQEHVSQWVNHLEFAPASFNQATISEIHAIYVPIWLFSATAISYWQWMELRSRNGKSTPK